ncbi:MAG: hypothetical protein ABI481_06980 [Pyrinomonadaceae bacterium]
MTISIFRGLILGVWALTVLYVVVALASQRYLPPELSNYLDSVASTEVTVFRWAIFAITAFLFFVLIIATVGLYKFKRWGRTLFLWTNVGSLAILPAHGISIELGFVTAVQYLGVLVEGGLLFAMYLPPIGPLFDEQSQGIENDRS